MQKYNYLPKNQNSPIFRKIKVISSLMLHFSVSFAWFRGFYCYFCFRNGKTCVNSPIGHENQSKTNTVSQWTATENHQWYYLYSAYCWRRILMLKKEEQCYKQELIYQYGTDSIQSAYWNGTVKDQHSYKYDESRNCILAITHFYDDNCGYNLF